MVKFLVMDVDGTLTDGKIYIGSTGEAFKAFDVKDGCGIKDILPRYNIVPIIITARKSIMLQQRCEELGIEELHQDVRDKIEELKNIIKKYNEIHEVTYTLKDCAYIGDDILDLQCMEPIKQVGGIVGCPSDAVLSVKNIAQFISSFKSGEGAVREFIEFLTHTHKTKTDEVGNRIKKAIDYISGINLKAAPIGKYNLDDIIYYMVQEYETKLQEKCKLEAHEKYVDIQWIIRGKEKIYTSNSKNLKVITPYSDEKDVIFFEKPARMQEIVLFPNSYVVLYPEDAHMPCVAVDAPEYIKKVVIKVKI